jgi:ABC-type Fe3+/spermidine/putrescine transport system ATPase subunit
MNYKTLARPDWSNETEYKDELTALQNKYGISELLYTREDSIRLTMGLVAMILKDIQKETKVKKEIKVNKHLDDILKNYIKDVEAFNK